MTGRLCASAANYADGQCDVENDVVECLYDGGDCASSYEAPADGGARVLDGGGAVRVLHVTGGSTLELSFVVVRGGFSAAGGGAYVSGATFVATSTYFRDNSATATAAVLGDGGATVSLSDVVVAQNEAYVSGAVAALAGSTLELSFVAVVDNAAAGVYVDDDVDLHVSDSSVSRNAAAAFGGGVAVYGGSRATLNRVVIANNTFADDAANKVDYFGGLVVHGSSALVDDSEITGNDASEGGGGGLRVVGGVVSISWTAIRGNAAEQGGGVAAVAASVVEAWDVDVAGNVATRKRGADAGGGQRPPTASM